MLKTRSSRPTKFIVYHDSIIAFQFCDVDFKPLPFQEQAINIEFNLWLILSASCNYQLIQLNSRDSITLNSVIIQESQACNISLKYGEHFEGPNVLMRSDANSIAELLAMRIDVKLPTAIDHLFEALPAL